MKISVLTPCFNAENWISACMMSVARQVSQLFSLEHFVQDACSTDETLQILESKRCLKKMGDKGDQYEFRFSSEKDSGMYDALNRAFSKTDGEVVGHLNADEQYLPGTLDFVAKFFEEHPDIDVLFGAAIVVDKDGNYICSRIPLKPQLLHTQLCHLCTFTASMFFRRAAIEKVGVYFDDSFKCAGDADLVCRMLKAKLKMATTRRYLALFADTGDNLALSPQAQREGVLMGERCPELFRKIIPVFELLHRLRKFLCGCYMLRPFSFKFIMTNGSEIICDVKTPKGKWVR